MSAIAFYDSGRLLPYRHDLKQKQIEQRNIDAENTRKYIGYAGGAFANMAERTGTIFGGRLGKAPAVDSEGEPVAKYGGGTVGAEYAKAEWQKGTLDSESRRREVTHRLGLLTENVKYGNLQRDIEAWKGFDKKVLREAYEKKWDQYLEHSRSMDKIDLIKNYQSMFSKKTRDVYANYAAATTEEDKKKYSDMLMDNLIHAPLQSFEKYAEENEYYDPAIAAKPREDVKLLMAYLREGVKFPGMNDLMDKYKAQLAGVGEPPKKEEEPTKQEQQAAIIEEARKNVKVKPELKRTDSEKEDEPGFFDPFFKLRSTELEKQSKKSDPKNIGGRKFPDLDPMGYVPYEGMSARKTKVTVDGKEVAATEYRPSPHVQASTLHQQEQRIKELIAKENIGAVPFVRERADGSKMTLIETAKQYIEDTWDVLKGAWADNKAIISGENMFKNIHGIHPSQLLGNANQLFEEAKTESPEAEDRMTNEIMSALHKMKAFNEVSQQELDEAKMESVHSGTTVSEAVAGTIRKQFGPDNPEDVAIKTEADLTPQEIAANQNTTQFQEMLKRPYTHTDGTRWESYSKFLDEHPMPRTSNTFSEDMSPLSTEQEMADHEAAHGVVDTTTTYENMSVNDVIKNTRLFEDNRAYGTKLINSGYIIDDSGSPILPGSVNLNLQLKHLPMDERIAEANRIIDMIGGFPKNSAKRKMLLEYATTDMGNVREVFGYDKNKTNKDKLSEKQKAARRLIKFTPKQVDKLVDYTWRNEFKKLNKNHEFLNDQAYSKNPYLKHILGDMAYRLGPNFMNKGKEKYEGLRIGVRDLVNTPVADVASRIGAWDMMYNSISLKYPQDHEDRYDYLLNRLDMLKGIITKGRYVRNPKVYSQSIGLKNNVTKKKPIPVPAEKYSVHGDRQFLQLIR